MDRLSKRIAEVPVSRTVHLSGVIDTLRRQGEDIINLGIGEPHEPPHPDIIGKTVDALNAGKTRYGPIGGLPELRGAIAQAFKGYDSRNILITNGSKQALFMALQVLCNPGDEVIIPRPCWVSFCEQIKLAGGLPVLVDTRAHQLDPVAIQKAINPRTKAIIINSPNNPTGAVYPKEDLLKIAEIAETKDLCLISDEAYEAFVYDGLAHSSPFDFPHARNRLIVVRSFSKTHAMTGFRIGYAAADEKIITAMARLQSHLTGNVCTFAQYGALAATACDPAPIDKLRNGLQKKRDLALEMLKDLPCPVPQGAFYLFPDISPFLKKDETAEMFAEKLLRQTHVAVAPGEAFGADGHVRICYAVEEQQLMEGLSRMNRFIRTKTGVRAP